MEALILIFGEMIFAFLAPLVAVVVDLIGAVLAAIFSLLPFGRGNQRVSSDAAKKVFFVLLAIAIVIFGGLLVINSFYFADSVRTVFGVLERRSGIETSCTEIEGSVFSGQLSLGDCTIVRKDHASSEFELELDKANLNLQLSSLFGTANVQEARIAGLRGSVKKHPVPADSSGTEVAEKPRRAFEIQDLGIEGVEISLSGVNKDGGSFELPVRIQSATSAPLRSRLALFDILFRSNATGEIAAAEFEVKTGGDSGGRQTVWRASDVPVASFGSVAGGVLSWFHDGVVDVYVVDKWRRDGQLEIDMDWKLGFRNVEVRAPDTAGVVARLATGPIVDYVNSHDGDFPFEFQMVINESQFEYQSSLEAAGLWTVFGESVNRLLKAVGIVEDGAASDTADKLKEGAKSVLDRLRKPKDE